MEFKLIAAATFMYSGPWSEGGSPNDAGTKGKSNKGGDDYPQ